ncbi:MAG: acetyl-CoA carboxylase biotin carboxyl carrier protein subunit [Pedobacter sp.]
MKVKVNKRLTYELDIRASDITLDEKLVDLDYRKINTRQANILYKNRSFNVELVEENTLDKTFTVKVNGNIYLVDIEDQYDLLLKQLGLDNSRSGKIADVKAPMPGLVLKVLIVPRQKVLKGDNLLVLEAMKMENMIKSPTDGVVTKLLVGTGDKIEKNTILLQFD